MFAIAFDLVVKDIKTHYEKDVATAYVDIGNILSKRDFNRIQGSLYVCDNENMANLFAAIEDLKALPWFSKVVRYIRAFRIEQWSDFTDTFKTKA